MEILLNGIKLNELLEKIGQLIDSKIGQVQPSITPKQSKFISRAEVAKLLKISLPTLNEWTKLGWLLAYKMGNRVLYNADEVELSLCKVTARKYRKGGNHAA
jgi:excisionase family DNA binding protein